MLSTALYSYSSYIGARLNRLDPNDTPFYDYSQPRIKSLLLNNYDWILSTYKDGRMRDAVLDNVLKTIICRTSYLGYDEFVCPECKDWILIYRHFHSRFCTKCGGYHEYKDTSNTERKTSDYNTCSTVSLICEDCGHQESMKISEYESYLKWMPDKNDQKILCPFCFGYMRPVNDKDKK